MYFKNLKNMACIDGKVIWSQLTAAKIKKVLPIRERGWTFGKLQLPPSHQTAPHYQNESVINELWLGVLHTD